MRMRIALDIDRSAMRSQLAQNRFTEWVIDTGCQFAVRICACAALAELYV